MPLSDYGVQPTGLVIKRLDTIVDELHTDLSEGWGVNTRLNPESFLNVQLTAYADKIADLWELGAQIYHSMYPYSAENAALDNAVQYGGITREDARPTYYPIHAECVDGTVIPQGSIVRTNTNPAMDFIAPYETAVTRSACNKAKIRLAVIEHDTVYSIALDGELYHYAPTENDGEGDILRGLRSVIDSKDFTIKAEGSLLIIEALDLQKSATIVLSGNLTTESVTARVYYASEENGLYEFPNGTITQIITAVPGLLGVANLTPYIGGRLVQSDVDLRKSYADKIFGRANRILEAIKSAILQNVQGVNSVAVYQNDTDRMDKDGRWPHCIEVVVDGGSDAEIAQQIWDNKADGIQAFGDIEVIVPGDEGEPMTMRFNRPQLVHVWFRLTITLNPSEAIPPNYVEAIEGIILARMRQLEPGKSLVPQKVIENAIYGQITGIAYIMTETFATPDSFEEPTEYRRGMVEITPRQRAVTDVSRIEVLLAREP